MYRGLVAIILVLGSLLISSSASYGTETAVISAASGTPTCSGAPKTQIYSQRIISGANISIVKVTINMAAALSSDTVEIRATNLVGTDGTLVGTLNYSAAVAVNTYFAASFTGNVTLQSNTQYWFILRGSLGDSICYDPSAYTTTNGFDFAKSSSSYQWSYSNVAFNYGSHWSMSIFTGITDGIAPIITSNEVFSVSENQVSVGTITTSESSTITIFGGADQARFSLARIDSTSATLAFVSVPNFEVPVDTGLDNGYVVVLRATDSAGNAGYETVTANVIDVDEIARLLSYSISGIPRKGTQVTITATVNFSGKVTFLVGGKRIAGCLNRSTSGVGPITATCLWKPAVRGINYLAFNVVPSASNNFTTTSSPAVVTVENRTNKR